MKTVLEILNELEAFDSRLAKEAILLREKNNEQLQDVLKAAVCPTINYFIKKIPPYAKRHDGGTHDLSWGLAELHRLSSREFTGNAGITHLETILTYLSKENAEVIERIIQRDLRCGVQEATINKIWPGLIFSFDVLLCNKDTSGIKYPAFAQEKGDGCRVHIFFDGVNVKAFTRNGKELLLHGVFDEEAKKVMYPSETLDGELLCFENDKVMDRKTGNGIVNKAVKQTISEKEAKQLRVMVWDIVDFSSKVKYKDRFYELNSRFKTNKVDKFFVCPTEIVNSEEEAQEFYIKMRKAKKEGAIIKNFDLLWEGKRVKGAGKMKAVEEADMIITGIVEGTGKYAGMLGAFEMETSDGKVAVNVGTGFSDDQRREFFDQKYVGKIGTVAYNEIIVDKRTGKHSLFLPRWIELRFDKSVGNSFGELK